MDIQVVILAGGSGTRLWPLSRSKHPKQFLSLQGENSMLQATVKRLSNLKKKEVMTICNEEHRFFVAEQLRQIDSLGSILLEPFARNTAPAIALAAFLTTDNPVMLILPADHVIEDQKAFLTAISNALPLAKSGKLVTFGVNPTEAHTGYGYIKSGRKLENGYQVDEFIEKPNKEKANEYLDAMGYFWNSGIFLFQAKKFLIELQRYQPEIYKICEASVTSTKSDNEFIRINSKEFENCPNMSIDYAVMEKTKDAVVVPMQCDWNDVGSWTSLWDLCEKDENGNATDGDIILHNSKDSYIRTDSSLVTTLGVNNLVIIVTKDVVLVADKQSVQDVKKITEKLEASQRDESKIHREVYRPWGKYDSLDVGKGYQVKRISVKPGAKLSVQKHNHRSEHWVVVSGTAKVTKGNKTFLLNENESTYIPLGEIHALENPTNQYLELIEVQSGDYLGEDDIIRFEDRYGRVIN